MDEKLGNTKFTSHRYIVDQERSSLDDKAHHWDVEKVAVKTVLAKNSTCILFSVLSCYFFVQF